jgi:hypothetical protein
MWATWACTIPYLSKEKPFESSTRTPFFRPEPVNPLFSRPLPLLSNGDLPVSLYPSPQASQEAMSANGSFLGIESEPAGLWPTEPSVCLAEPPTDDHLGPHPASKDELSHPAMRTVMSSAPPQGFASSRPTKRRRRLKACRNLKRSSRIRRLAGKLRRWRMKSTLIMQTTRGRLTSRLVWHEEQQGREGWAGGTLCSTEVARRKYYKK